MGPGASVTDRRDRGPEPDGWLHERAVCLWRADSISESIVNSQERERTMEPRRLDTFVSCCKTKRSTRKPKTSRDFIGVKFFGPEKVFFHLTGTLYGWQLERVAGSSSFFEHVHLRRAQSQILKFLLTHFF